VNDSAMSVALTLAVLLCLGSGMAVNDPYCELDELKERLNRTDPTDTADDAQLMAMILAASRQIDAQTGDFFYAITAGTFTLSADDTGFISTPPLRAVTSLATDDGTRAYLTAWASTDYDLEPENASVWGKPYTGIRTTPNGRYTFPTGAKSVRIVGDWGWAAVPAAIKEATLILASRLLKRTDAPLGVLAVVPDAPGVQLRANDPDVTTLIAPFRRFGVGVI
jgi:hypothetical protein